jgi:archaetidylinositol phosphate synthase
MTNWTTIDPPWDQRLARILVKPLTRTTITPNQVTSVSLLCGVAGGVLLGMGGALAGWGALLYVLAQFIDHMDGELARATGQTSVFGHYYDHVAGGIFEVVMFAGVGIGLQQTAFAPLGQEIFGPFAAMMGGVAAFAVGVTVTLRMEIFRKFGRDAIDQPGFGGFEIEDIMYVVGPLAWFGGLDVFLLLASIGTPIFMLMTIREYFVRRRDQ